MCVYKYTNTYMYMLKCIPEHTHTHTHTHTNTEILVERREAIRAESRFGFDHNEPIIMLQKVAS